MPNVKVDIHCDLPHALQRGPTRAKRAKRIGGTALDVGSLLLRS
jgi:hypothetical protein